MSFFKKKPTDSPVENAETNSQQPDSGLTENQIKNQEELSISSQQEISEIQETKSMEQSNENRSSHAQRKKKGAGNTDPAKKNNGPSIKLIPLGGLGEIGRNMMAIEWGNDIVVVDAGVMFPDSSFPGMDLILPDISYLKAHAKNIRALMITHGHEDHIGAVPYVLQILPNVPIYAPKMAMELIKGKLHEHKVRYQKDKMVYIEPKKLYQLCRSFSVEYVEVNHSIPDSFGLAIHTPLGLIVHTGDFKIEMDGPVGKGFDFHRFAEIGQQKVLLLCSDSTNVEKKQEERTETEAIQYMEGLIKHALGRVLIATFASNVHRVAKLAEITERLGKKLCLIGRNMENNFDIAQRLGYINIKKSTLIPYKNAKNYPDHNLVIISTGTQGETLSALTRISQGLHKVIKLKAMDTVIISASVIPGNEKAVSKVLDMLADKTHKVYYSRNAPVHTSGHAPQSDLLLMLKLIQPKFFMPVHGESRFLLKHASLAQSVGIPVSHTLVCQNGDVVQVNHRGIQKAHKIKYNNLLVQGGIVDSYYGLIQERNSLSTAGTLFIVIGLDYIRKSPSIYLASKGFLLPEQEQECFEMITQHLDEMLMIENFDESNITALTTKYRKSIEFLLNSKYRILPIVELKILEQTK